jgi:hypothetical protein
LCEFILILCEFILILCEFTLHTPYGGKNAPKKEKKIKKKNTPNFFIFESVFNFSANDFLSSAIASECVYFLFF